MDKSATLLPTFKPPFWHEENVLVATLFDGEHVPSLAFLSGTNDNMSLMTHQQAPDTSLVLRSSIRNMEDHLKSIQWQTETLELSGTECSFLVLSGDDFCSEAILSETLMQSAQEILKANLIAAITPQRGTLYITGLTDPEQPTPEEINALEGLTRLAIEHYLAAQDDAITPGMWIMQAGNILTLSPPPPDYMPTPEEDQSLNLMASAPYMVFYIVCSVSGNITQEEILLLTNSLPEISYAIEGIAGYPISRLITRKSASLVETFTEITRELDGPLAAWEYMQRIREAIEATLPEDRAEAFMTCLFEFGYRLANYSPQGTTDSATAKARHEALGIVVSALAGQNNFPQEVQ